MILYVFILIVFYISGILLYLHSVERAIQDFAELPGHSIFKNAYEFSSHKKLIPNALKATEKYGGVLKIGIFYGLRILLLSEDKMIEFILGTSNIMNKGSFYGFWKRWLGTGLLTCREEKWKKTRKILAPAFHNQILEKYVDSFNSSSDILMRKFKEQSGRDAFDVLPFITLCTLDTICETAMGSKIHAQKNSESEYVKAVNKMCKIIVNRSLSPWKILDVFYKCSLEYREEKRCLEILHGYTDSIIKQRRFERLGNNSALNTGKIKERLAFLDLLLESTIDGRALTDEEIKHEVATFMFAGHDTVASAISFTLYCLSVNPDVQEKVVEELDNIFQDDIARPATYADLKVMRYLEMVIKESLRLYPSVPFFFRSASRDVEYNDTVIGKRAQIAIFVLGVHMNPNNFPNPEKFDPERFNNENQINRSPFKYLAFSAGPRNCIGQKFALLEIKATVSHILRKFNILPAPNFKPDLLPIAVLKSSNGVRIKLEDRRR